MVTQTINLNLVPDGVKPRLAVSQGDHGSRVFVFNIYSGSQAYDIPSGSTVLLNGTKPDGLPVSYVCDYTDNQVSADCEAQLTAAPGNVYCELEITGADGSNLGSANFIIFVEVNPQIAADTSSVDIESLQELVTQGATYAAQARAAAEEAASGVFDGGITLGAGTEDETTMTAAQLKALLTLLNDWSTDGRNSGVR